jgi:hypothetical protein
VAKKKLNLFELASASMAETGATATKIVGRQIFYASLPGTPFDCIPDYVGCHASILSCSIPPNPSEHVALAHARMPEPTINERLAPGRHRDSSHPSAFANQIGDNPVALPQLQLIQSQSRDFRASQSATQQQSKHGSVSAAEQSVMRNRIQ